MPVLRHDVTIAASPARVWAILTDVERWPERIPTVDTVERLEPGPLVVGSRTRLRQPRLPEAVWTVTELDEGTSFTWRSRSPGMAIDAGHCVELRDRGSRLELSVAITGPLSRIGWLMTRSLTQRYVEIEAASIKQAAEAAAT